ncbi:cyanobacterial porin (plasmid) [Chroococcidiopsis thermalis PCC 7203]|uniref:Cyanobacterial porin n=2 Tax=Chroococcidiopsis thermalis TaxID=54299 RepID=K9U7L2_CHRTP|nr:cyanobacterial porin [Chroococcidiopsis thermalis PCC 7203]
MIGYSKLGLYFASSLSILSMITQGAFAQSKASGSIAASPTITTAQINATIEPQATPVTNTQIAQAASSNWGFQDRTAGMTTSKDPVTSASQLADVQPTDWAFHSLQALIERYGCIAGYPKRTYKGNQALTRYEFAAGLNACLRSLVERIEVLTPNDLTTLRRLQENFVAELALLRGRVDSLEVRTTELEANQFSTTTKLTGQAIFAVTGGGFSGERIIAPTGVEIADEDPNSTFIYRASLTFNTSFQGTDLLQIRLVTGSDGSDDNAAGLLEPNFASVLDFSVPGQNGQFGLGRLYYTFTPVKDFALTVGSAILATDYVDRNSYANNSAKDFSTQALINNFILLPTPAGAGAVIDWNPGAGPFSIRGVYVAGNAGRATAGSNAGDGGFIGGPSAPELLFPALGALGDQGGLFGAPHQGFVELEYALSNKFAFRLQYSGGQIFGSFFNGVGANFELALSQQLAVFGRYGYAVYNDSSVGDLRPQYWMAGISLQNLFVPGAVAGIAAGQPQIEGKVGDATQTNFEAFYNFPLNDDIKVTPLVQVITDAGNQGSNGTIYTGTLRTVFSF